MGIIEILTGWQEVPEEKLHKGIIAIANKQISKKLSKINTKNGSSKVVVYVNGDTFKYKIIEPSVGYASFNGHECEISTGFRQYYRKLKPIKKND